MRDKEIHSDSAEREDENENSANELCSLMNKRGVNKWLLEHHGYVVNNKLTDSGKRLLRYLHECEKNN